MTGSMEVRVNTKKQILKAFFGWAPLAVVVVLFYCALLMVTIMWVAQSYLGLTEEEARSFSFPISVFLALVGTGLYFNWVAMSLLSYKLKVNNEYLIVKGKGGWTTIDKRLPLECIKGIYVGG